MRYRMAGFAAASMCALMSAGCGGDDVVDRCIERFNSPANETKNFVADSGDPAHGGTAEFRAPVWLGESKLNPEKCVAVVGLNEQGSFVVVRENVKPGTWVVLTNVTEAEGSVRELAARVREPVALGNPDGTIEAK
jgi:hypothetical protein